MPSRLPVMGNQYNSNIHFYQKREAPVPNPVNYSFNNLDRVNKFRTNLSQRRLVSDTWSPHDRSYMQPSSVSPLMMENGISVTEKHR